MRYPVEARRQGRSQGSWPATSELLQRHRGPIVRPGPVSKVQFASRILWVPGVHLSLRVVARVILALCALSIAFSSEKAPAQTRRAFLVGIDKYRPATAGEQQDARKRGTPGPLRSDLAWEPLDGAVNDALSMRDILLYRFGFTRENVHLLLDEKARRQAILDGIKAYLIEGAHDGDVLFFF